MVFEVGCMVMKDDGAQFGLSMFVDNCRRGLECFNQYFFSTVEKAL